MRPIFPQWWISGAKQFNNVTDGSNSHYDWVAWSLKSHVIWFKTFCHHECNLAATSPAPNLALTFSQWYNLFRAPKCDVIKMQNICHSFIRLWTAQFHFCIVYKRDARMFVSSCCWTNSLLKRIFQLWWSFNIYINRPIQEHADLGKYININTGTAKLTCWPSLGNYFCIYIYIYIHIYIYIYLCLKSPKSLTCIYLSTNLLG